LDQTDLQVQPADILGWCAGKVLQGAAVRGTQIFDDFRKRVGGFDVLLGRSPRWIFKGQRILGFWEEVAHLYTESTGNLPERHRTRIPGAGLDLADARDPHASVAGEFRLAPAPGLPQSPDLAPYIHLPSVSRVGHKDILS
jgi:hypothetical protein